MTTGSPPKQTELSALFVSPFLNDPVSGGGLVSRMNLACLRHVIPKVEALALSREAPSGAFSAIGCPRGPLATALCNLGLLSGRLTPISLLRVMQRIRHSQPDLVFLDSSSLGCIAQLTRLLVPKAKVVSFFHNVEFDFQRERSRAEGCRYLLSATTEYINERMTVRSAHALLMLTEDDSLRVGQLYGRKADQLSPVSLADTCEVAALKSDPALGTKDDAVLFVGSGFFANREAVEFLLRQILSTRKLVF